MEAKEIYAPTNPDGSAWSRRVLNGGSSALRVLPKRGNEYAAPSELCGGKREKKGLRGTGVRSHTGTDANQEEKENGEERLVGSITAGSNKKQGFVPKTLK